MVGVCGGCWVEVALGDFAVVLCVFLYLGGVVGLMGVVALVSELSWGGVVMFEVFGNV